MDSLKLLALKATLAKEVSQNTIKPSTISTLLCLDLSDNIPISGFVINRQTEGFDPMNDISKTIGKTCPTNCLSPHRRLILIKSFYTGNYTVAATVCCLHNSSYFTNVILNPSIGIDRNVAPMCLAVPSYFHANGTFNTQISIDINMPTSLICNETTYLTLEPLNFSNIKERFVFGFDTRDLIWLTTPLNTEIVITPNLVDLWFIDDIDIWIENCQK